MTDLKRLPPSLICSLHIITLALGISAVALADEPAARIKASAGESLPASPDKQPVKSFSVRRVDGQWQARLVLRRTVDSLEVKLNGKSIRKLFNADTLDPQVVRLAPDDGLRVGANTLWVNASPRKRRYAAKFARFTVGKGSLLASAGGDQNVKAYGPVHLEGRQTIQAAPLAKAEWRVLSAPAGSQVLLAQTDALGTSFTPDVNGTYQVELRVQDSRGSVATDVTTVSAAPNFPPIGVGIETMAWQEQNGNYAIVLGTNCTAEIRGCPDQQKILHYGSTPIQLVILDRQTLDVLIKQNFQGTPIDANTAATLIGQYTASYKAQNKPRPLVILSALYRNTPGSQPNFDIDPAFLYVIQMLVSESSAPLSQNSFLYNNKMRGGWSVIGVQLDSGTAGPAGNLMTGAAHYISAGTVGNAKGYLQTARIAGNSNFDFLGYNFAFGDYAAFTTRADAAATANNTMRINGIDFTSESLTGSCQGGFQLVVLQAGSLASFPAGGSYIPENRTFFTNCRSSEDAVQTQALGNALNDALNIGDQNDGALVFLQSIGIPLDPNNTNDVLYKASSALSQPIERLGGIAQAFNNAMLQPTGIPGYALAGSTAIVRDAPKASPVGFYAPEAAGAAPGVLAQSVFLTGMLQRSYLGRYAPLPGAAVGDIGQVASLPMTVFQPGAPWPHTSTAAEHAALECISDFMTMDYDSQAACYLPSFKNIRANYCDAKAADAGSTWRTKLREMSYSNALATCKNASEFDQATFDTVIKDIRDEVPKLTDLKLAKDQYDGIYLGSAIDSKASIETWAQKVADELKGEVSNTAKVAGTWMSLLGNLLKVVAIVSPDPFTKAVGNLGSMASLSASFLTLNNGTSDLGTIVDTAAEDVPVELYSRYKASKEQLGKIYEILASDTGKLDAKALTTFNDTTTKQITLTLEKSAKEFAYARILSAAYISYGLLPDSKFNPGYPYSPNDYWCYSKRMGGAVRVFDKNSGRDALNKTWIGLNYPNISTRLPIYDGNPNLLVLGHYRNATISNNGFYESPDIKTMDKVMGLGEWPIWFFRHNFIQYGFSCSNYPG